MAAPSGTGWGNIVSDYARIGIYLTTSSSDTTTTVNVQIWFWSKYSVADTNNSFYWDDNSSYATTNRGARSIYTYSNTGGWSTDNQILLASTSFTYSRGTSSYSRTFAARLSGIEVASGTMTHTWTYTVPARNYYTISYNANGGSGAPGSHGYYYGTGTVTLSSTRPTRTGYTFLGWSTSSTATSAQYQPGASWSNTNKSNTTLYAVWQLNSYAITYNAGYNGGTVDGSEEITKNVYYGYTLGELPVAERKNYAFLGWYTTTDTSGLKVSEDTFVYEAMTLYAVFELQANCYIKDSDEYKTGMMYVRDGGTYKTGVVYVKDNGTYKATNM